MNCYSSFEIFLNCWVIPSVLTNARPLVRITSFFRPLRLLLTIKWPFLWHLKRARREDPLRNPCSVPVLDRSICVRFLCAKLIIWLVTCILLSERHKFTILGDSCTIEPTNLCYHLAKPRTLPRFGRCDWPLHRMIWDQTLSALSIFLDPPTHQLIFFSYNNYWPSFFFASFIGRFQTSLSVLYPYFLILQRID